MWQRRRNQQVVFTHLTLVRAVVSFLHVFYFQCPIIRAFSMQHGEPLVVCICEHARSQDVPISAANPWYLKPQSNILYDSVRLDKTVRAHCWNASNLIKLASVHGRARRHCTRQWKYYITNDNVFHELNGVNILKTPSDMHNNILSNLI